MSNQNLGNRNAELAIKGVFGSKVIIVGNTVIAAPEADQKLLEKMAQAFPDSNLQIAPIPRN